MPVHVEVVRRQRYRLGVGQLRHRLSGPLAAGHHLPQRRRQPSRRLGRDQGAQLPEDGHHQPQPDRVARSGRGCVQQVRDPGRSGIQVRVFCYPQTVAATYEPMDLDQMLTAADIITNNRSVCRY